MELTLDLILMKLDIEQMKTEASICRYGFNSQETHFCLRYSSCNFSVVASSLDIKVPEYLHRSLCLSLLPLIKMLICGHSLFRPRIIASVFLLFHYKPLFLLSSSAISCNRCKFSFSQLIQCHRRISRAFLLELL